MAIRQDEMTSANNISAEAGLPPTKATGTNANGFDVTGGAAGDPEGDSKWLGLIRSARTAQESYAAGPKMRWQQAYRAYNNQHFSDSKYLSDRWRGRSKLHRPKTRNSVHKADARAANALFASTDVVQTSATDPSDPKQQASADICKEILNYRLNRSSPKAGVPWFQIAVGAHNDARMTGKCASKQCWDRREIHTGKFEPVMGEPAPQIDPMTGQQAVGPDGQPIMGEPMPVMEPGEGGIMRPKVKPVMRVVRDRPMIQLYPPEYVWVDPGANWINQAEGSYLALLHPMSIGDAFAMMNSDQNTKSSVKWRPMTKEQLGHCRTPQEVTGPQAAREQQTNDRYGVLTGVPDFNTTWLIEWFVREEGREWHFWTGACLYLASDPMPLDEAYPFCKGERPVVIGVSVIEPHKIDPMSPVQAALPLQQEMNDLVNLRMDGVKENVRPLTIARAGQGIDANAIQNRSGDTVIYAKNPKEDIHFDRPAAIGAEAYEEMAHLNADFDDTTGEFNGSSVAMNRQINETVGGMKLLNTSANIMGDFDLRVWIETWVEPALRQIMRAIQYYEDDETILTVAAKKAKLWTKYGVDAVTDELLEREIMLTVDAGMGTADPAVALEKFAMAAKITGGIIGQEVQARVKQDDVIDEIFSKAGYKSAADRFFHPGDQTDPRITKLKEMLQQQAAELQSKDADRANQVELARIKVAGDLLKQYLANIQAVETAEMQHDQNIEGKVVDHVSKTSQAKMAGEQRLKEIKAKPAPGGKPTASAAKPEGAGDEPSPTGDNPVIAQLLAAMAQMLAPQSGGPLTPDGAAQGQQGAPQPPQQPAGPDPMQMMGAQMQTAAAMQQQMMQITQALAAVMQMQQQLAQTMTAPKTIVRGEGGKIVGVESPGMPMRQVIRGPDGQAIGIQ